MHKYPHTVTCNLTTQTILVLRKAVKEAGTSSGVFLRDLVNEHFGLTDKAVPTEQFLFGAKLPKEYL